jgi:hypothetical protein
LETCHETLIRSRCPDDDFCHGSCIRRRLRLAHWHDKDRETVTIDRRLKDFRYITEKELLNSRRLAYGSIRRGENVKDCEELIERLDTELQRRQPTLYPSHDNAHILRPDRGELVLNIPNRKK